MCPIAASPFWDNRGSGGVRSSSEGENASKYLDPATQSLESSDRSLASLMPSGGRGLRGVVIPRATAFGGSRGFDPQKPALVNIDPDIKGQSCVVDLSKITKESMEEAFLKAAEDPVAQTDIRLLAAQTYQNLAVGYEPVGMTSNQGSLQSSRAAPLSGTSYVVPKASLGGGQVIEEQAQPTQARRPTEIMSPSVQKRGTILPPGLKKRAAAVVEEEEVELQMPPEEDKPRFTDQSVNKTPPRRVILQGPAEQKATRVGKPMTKVVFEMEGWGTFEAMYHAVIKNDCLLVLVYDVDYKEGMRFFPQASNKPIAVRIEDGDVVYFVSSFDNRFIHDGHEYCILVIEQEGKIESTK